MTIGELAAIISAIAFLVLVIFLVLLILRVRKTVGKLDKTIDEANSTINQVTNDVNLLTVQVEGLLVKSNTLLDDLNGKVATIDPVFQAVADLGVSVSDLNDSSRQMVTKVAGITKNTGKAAVATSIGKGALRFIKPIFKNKNKEQ